MTYTNETVGYPPPNTSRTAGCPRCQAHFWGGVIAACLTTAALVAAYALSWKRGLGI